MAEQIIKQPCGLFCVFNTVSDGISVYDATEKELRHYFIDKAVKLAVQESINRFDDKIEKIEKGEAAYYQFTMTFEEAVDINRASGFDDIPFGNKEEK